MGVGIGPVENSKSGDGTVISGQNEPLCVKKEMAECKQKENDATRASTVGVLDSVVNVAFWFLLAVVFVVSVVCITAGAFCLASLSGLPFARFLMFYFMGVGPIVVGTFILLLSVCAVALIALRFGSLRRQFVGFVGASASRRALYVCICVVLPFILFAVLLGLSILGFSFYSLSRQVPPLDKNYAAVPGIAGPVKIIRDKNGLVHIKAQNRRDAYFGQGFVQAQDRLFQLEFYRLVGRGELASIVGADGIQIDRTMRIVNLKIAAASLCKNADPKDLGLLKAFTEGINYYLRHESKRPVEFFFMSSRPLYFHEPRPFTVDDVCVITRLLQFQMSSGTSTESERFSLFLNSNRNYESVDDLFNKFNGSKYTILTAEQLNLTATDLVDNARLHTSSAFFELNLYNTVLDVLRPELAKLKVSNVYYTPQTLVEESVGELMSKRFFIDEEMDIFGNKRLHASNAWMARDSNNHAVGASDPHLRIEFPSVWFFTHLSFLDDGGAVYDAAGVSMVGLPGVHIGKTTYVSWGITFSMTDLEDTFLLANIGSFNRAFTSYFYRGKERKFVPRRERIAVSGGKDIVLDLEDTLFGPVVNELTGLTLPPAVKIALYSVPLRANDKDSISVLLSLTDPAVRTAYQLMTNLRRLPAPGFSIPISDRDGNIAYTITGRHPERAFGHTGKYPNIVVSLPPALFSLFLMRSSLTPPKTRVAFNDTYVSDDPNVPDAFIPQEKLPHFHGPADGTLLHISAANQKIYPEGYAYELGFDYAWPYRGRRLQELLHGLQNELPEQMSNVTRHMEIQLDIKSNVWDQDFRAVVGAFDMKNEAAPTKLWHKRLMDWDGRASVGSQEAAFFWRWVQSLDVLPLDVTLPMSNSRYVVQMLTKPDSNMEEMCRRYAKLINLTETNCAALGLALFRRLASTDFQERWGIDLNRLTGIHTMLHKKPIRPVFERTIAKDGDASSLSVSGHSIEGNMESTQASSMRMIYDMRKPDSVFFALPGGASGNPYSEFYQNLLEKFAKGEYVEAAASATGLDTLLSTGGARYQQELSPVAAGATTKTDMH